jgi:hypothetical protein
VIDPRACTASGCTRSRTRPKCVTSSSMTPPTGSCATKSYQCPAQLSGHYVLYRPNVSGLVSPSRWVSSQRNSYENGRSYAARPARSPRAACAPLH